MPYRDLAQRAAYLRSYRQENAVRLAEQRRAYAQANRDHLRATWQAWCLAHPDERRAIVARARKTFESSHREQILDKNARRRARLASVTVERVDRTVVFARDHGRCGLCGRFVARA